MPTITFSGLNSGLDTSSWIEALVSVRQTTITSLQAEQTAQQELLNVVNNIKSYFTSFQTALQKITDSQFGIASLDLFLQNLAISSNPNIVTATATTDAARQDYEIYVDQLASATKATSGYTQTETMYAKLDTTLGTLGVKAGNITVNQQSFSVSQSDTIQDLIDKFREVGVIASFDEDRSTFTVGTALNLIDDSTTGLKTALKLQDTTIQGATSGSMVFINRDSELYKIGLTGGAVRIEGVTHTITKNGNNYTIRKDVAASATTINTLGQFLDYLNSSAVNAEQATVDDKGNITIRGAVIESVTGGSNIKDVLNLGDVTDRTVMQSNNLTWQKGHYADLTTTLQDLGITGNNTLVINGASQNIANTTSLQTIHDTLAASGIDMSIDNQGVITIDTNGAVISGTLLDALQLTPDKGGTTLTSDPHTVTYQATGDTLLSTLGVTNTMTYTAYRSDGTAITGTINNNGNLTVDGFIAKLRGQGLDASFDENTHQITINDGYITGDVATTLGMTQSTVVHQEFAVEDTVLSKLGATGNQTLSIDGGAAKTFGVNDTLKDVIDYITAQGGEVTFRDGIMNVSKVTLSGTLPALLGFVATNQGTAVTSGPISVVTNSSSTSDDSIIETTDNDITLTSKIGDITGSTANYTLSVNGVSTNITANSTLQTVSNAITAQGGTFRINDDNTITIEDVNLSGTLVTALGLAAAGQGTDMTSRNPITVGGVENLVTETNTLAQLGATGNSTLVINGTNHNYNANTTLNTIFNDIEAAGGTADIQNGIVYIQGVTLSGTAMNLMDLQATVTGSTITSGNLTFVSSTTSSSTSSLTPTETNTATLSSTLAQITGGTSSYTLNINGTNKTYNSNTTLATIRNDIVAAGGSMEIDDEGVITVESARLSGTLLGALGLSATGQSTVMSSNDPIRMTQSYLIDGTTTIGGTGSNSLNVATNRRDYAIYDTYGNIIKASSTDGTTGSSTVNDWMAQINAAMNTYYGTTGTVYAEVDNGVIRIYDGYVTGSLPTAIGMKTESIVSGKQITGSVAKFEEANTEFIGKVSDQYIPSDISARRVSAVSSFSSGSTYYLTDASDVTKLASLVNGGANTAGVTFIMTNDIDMGSATFTPIGNDASHAFRGTFLGNGYTVNNINYNNTSSSYGGLFGYTNGATIQDIGVSNVAISAGNTPSYVGGLIGYANNTTVENSFVVNTSTGMTLMGGGTAIYVGGLVGYAAGTTNINNSYANIAVGGVSNATMRLGGLVGLFDGNTISNSFAEGTVASLALGSDLAMGGFAGENRGTITNSYTNSAVNAGIMGSDTSHPAYIGGFVGINSNGSISNSYANNSSHLNSPQPSVSGGFIGMNSGTTSFSNNAYNKDIYGTSSSSDPGAIGNGTGDGIYSQNAAQVAASLPTLLGSNPTINRYIYDSTTLSKLGLTTDSDRTISVTIDGTRQEHSFAANATVQDVVDYLNTLTGVTATFEDSVLRVKSETSQNITVGGRLGLTLMGDNPSESAVYETSTSAEKIYYTKNNVVLSNATRVGDLIGAETTGTLNLLINDTQVSLSYGPDTTVGEIISDMAQYGITASVSSTGVFSFTSDDRVSFFGDLGRALTGASGTITYTDNDYQSGKLDATITSNLSTSTTLASLGVTTGNIQIIDGNGNFVNSIDIDSSQTIGQLITTLSAYGFNMQINTPSSGRVQITTSSDNTLADGASNLITALHLGNWTETDTRLTTTTKLSQMGFADGADLTVVLDGNSTMNLSFGANNTVQDVINSLGAFGITATVDANGRFSATSNNHSFVFSGDLGSYLTQGTTGYVDKDIGFESANTLTYRTNTTELRADTTIEDLLGVKQDGVLRITIDDSQIINLDYSSDDTVQSVLDDLANLGIDATISPTGVFSASSIDKTFVLSGSIGRALQGNAPTYTDIDYKYESGDLSYQLTSNADNNSILADLGINSGQIFVLDRDGNVVDSIDINNEMTVSQTRAALLSYGFNMGIDGTGKVTISSNDGFSLTDGSSNLVSQFKLNTWNQAESRLTTGTTLAQMGFLDGADLNLLIDGSTPTTITFGATDTVQDIINSLQALGIDASVNATNGAFTAISKEHTFVFSGDLGKLLTDGTAGYVNTDKGYITEDPLMVDVPVVTNTSKLLDYSHALTATDTVASMGFADGGVVRLILDGNTPYSFNFLATDTMQDIMDTLATYGIQTTIGADGSISLRNDDHTITLGGALGSYLVQGGTYTNKDTGYTSESLTFETTEKIDGDTKLSDLGVANGTINVMKDGVIADTLEIDDETTIQQLFNAIKVYDMTGSILTEVGTGNTSIQIYSLGDTYLTDGTSDVVTQLGLHIVDQGDYNGNVTYWDTGVTSGLLTEDTLLTSLDKNGKTSVGSLIFELGTGDKAVQHIVNISADETVGSFLDKMEAEGVHAVLDNGVIKLDNSVYGITFTGGSSGILDTLGLTMGGLYTYATSADSITYQDEVTYSVANYADGSTTLDIVNVTDGKMSIYVDGVKSEINVSSTDTFADVFSRMVSQVAADTGVTIRAGFVDHDGNIIQNPTAAQNTGIIAVEVVGDHELVIGASNDTTNFATIANLQQQSDTRVSGSRALYKVNVNSLITGNGLFKDGNITAGDFIIGDATFTIDNTTTLNDLINQINRSDKSYATAYWDTLSGTLVLQSTLTGESLINIESGTSNFTDIMGFTEVVGGNETLVTDRQELGKNAIVRINGTRVTSTSNTITSDISKIKGLTINLHGLSEGESTTITVEQDREGIYNAVADIIDAYNTLMAGLEDELDDDGALAHDNMFKIMKNNLKRLMTQSVAGTTTYRNLAAIGISTGEAQDSISTDVTALIIDEDKFMQALEENSDAVKQLLVGTTANPGLFVNVGRIIDNTLLSTGLINSTQESINKNINRLGDKISDLTEELAHYRESLENKFRHMEEIISNMQSAYSSFIGAG